MNVDPNYEVRKGVLTLLKSDATLVALVPVASIHSQTSPASPTWPFVKYGTPSGIPISGSCIDGEEVTVALHGFSKPFTDGFGAIIVSAEDRAAAIGHAIRNALNRRVVDIAGGRMTIRYRNSQLLQDGGEADAFHAVVNFRVRLIA